MEKPKITLDFSEFHPLDHFAFDRRCRSLPGGGRRHLRHWWDFQRPGWERDWDWDHPVDDRRSWEKDFGQRNRDPDD